MKYRIRIIGTLALFSIAMVGNSKTENKIIVTDFFHFLRNTQTVEEYPIHFKQDSVWCKDLINKVTYLIKGKFKNNEVVHMNDRLGYKTVFTNPIVSNTSSVPLKGMRQVSRSNAELFVAIYSTFQSGSTRTMMNESRTHHNFLMKVLVEDRYRNKVYTRKVRIPFHSVPSNYLYEGVISLEDFKSLYEQALVALWTESKMKFKMRKVTMSRSLTNRHWVENSNYFELKETDKKRGGRGVYELFHEGNSKGIIVLKSKGVRKGLLESLMIPENFNRYKKGGTITNQILNKNYKIESNIILGGSGAAQFLGLNAREINISLQDNSKVTKFELEGPALKGRMHGNNYEIRWSNNEILKIYTNGDLTAIIQYGREDKVKRRRVYYSNCHISKDLGDEQVGELMDVLMAGQIALEIEQEAVAGKALQESD